MTTAVRQTSNYQLAPPGFTPEQWAIFERDGIIFLEDALSPDEIQRYTDAIERVAHADPKFRADETFARQNIVEIGENHKVIAVDLAFSHLITATLPTVIVPGTMQGSPSGSR